MKMYLLAPLLLIDASAAERRFDLSCRGTSTQEGAPPKAKEMHLRIDLDARRYCTDECAALWQVKRATPRRLDFRRETQGMGEICAVESSYFDRTASRYHRTVQISGPTAQGTRVVLRYVDDLTCVARPFSGFPASARPAQPPAC